MVDIVASVRLAARRVQWPKDVICVSLVTTGMVDIVASVRPAARRV